MKPGDLVLIRFPQTNLRIGKLRPALVVAVAPGRHADVLIAMITSRDYQAVSGFDEIVAQDDPDFSMTHLKTTSIVRLRRLTSTDPSAIEARLGVI